MIELIDFSACPLSERNLQYGGRAGEKRGIVHQGKPWILKFPKNTIGMRGVEGISYVTSPLNEYVGSQIFRMLGFETQETLLGVCFDGKRYKPVCACRDFIDDEENEILIPYTALRNDASPAIMERNDRSFVAPSSIEEVIFQLKHNAALAQIEGASLHFFEVAIVDLLINNNDRNEDNWGLIKNKKTGSYRFAPVYDCGNCFSGKSSEEKIASMLADPAKLAASANNGVTAYDDEDGVRITNARFLRLDDRDLKQAILAVCQKAEPRLREIEDFIFSIPTEFEGVSIMSENRARFYWESLKIRYETMLSPRSEEIAGEAAKR